MPDLAQLAILIDSTGAKTGAEQAVKAAGDVQIAFEGMDQTVSASGASFQQLSPLAKMAATDFKALSAAAKEYNQTQRQSQAAADELTRSVSRQLTTANAQIKEGLARGFISPKEAQRMGEEAAKAYNAGILQVIGTQRGAGSFSQPGGDQLYANLAGKLSNVGEMGQRAATGLGGAERGMLRLIAVASGVPGPLGGVAAQLGRFALGPGTGEMVAVVAGLGLLIYTISKLGEEARKQRKELQDFITELDKAASHRAGQENPMQAYLDGLKKLGTALAAARKGLKALQDDAAHMVQTPAGLVRTEGSTPAQRAAAEQKINDILTARGELGRQYVERETANQEARLRKEQEAHDKAVADARERQQQLAAVADAERAALVLLLRLRGQYAAAEQVALDGRLEAIAREVAAMEHLNALEKERLANARAAAEFAKQSAAAVKGVEAALNAQIKQGASTGILGLQRAISTGGLKPIQLSTVDRSQMDAELKAALKTFDDEQTRVIHKQMEQQLLLLGIVEHGRQEAIKFATAAGAIPKELGYGASAISQYITAEDALAVVHANTKATAEELAAAEENARVAMANLVMALGNIAFQGKSAAAAVGRGITAGVSAGMATDNPIIGIVIGAVGVVSNLFSSAHAAREAEKQLRIATDKWNQDLTDWLAGITGSRSQFEQAAQDARKFAEQKFKEVLGFAKSQGQGFDFGKHVETVSDAEFQRMMDQAAAAGGRFHDEFKKLAEDYRIAQKALAEQRALAQQVFRGDLVVRTLEAQGRADEAAVMRKNLADAAEFRDAEKQHYDAATMALLAHTQALEMEKLVADQAAAAAAERQKKLQEQADLGKDLQVRLLAARGEDKAAEAMRLQLEQEREVRDAVANGISDQNLAMLKYVQTLETAKAAADAAAAAEAALAETRKAERAASQDLDVRFLEASGQSGAAADLRFQLQQARERADYVTQGFSADFLTKLDDIQKLEKGQYDMQKVVATDTQAAKATEPALTTKDITALSEQTGLRLDSRLFTTNVILRQIEQNTRRGTGVLVVNPVNGSLSSGPSLRTIATGVDRIGANDLTINNSAKGVPPSV